MTAHVSSTKWYSYTSSTQTMRTWVRRLHSYEDVPQEFQSAFPDQGASFPYTLLIPEERLSLFHTRNGKILCLYDDRFLVLEAERGRVHTFSSAFDEFLYLEQGRILLQSWLTITTLSGTVTIRFNTTNLKLLEPVMKKLRQGMKAPPLIETSPDEHELSKFNYLSPLNFKYMNYGRLSLFPGDAVRQIAYQPERCIAEGMNLLKHVVFRRYATSHLSVLTERELILIKENTPSRSAHTAVYGGVFTYIPQRKIHDITFTPNPEKACCTMEIALPKNIRLRSEFSLDNAELDVLQQAVAHGQTFLQSPGSTTVSAMGGMTE